MTHRDPVVHLLSRGVVRAAARPIESVLGLGAPDLAAAIARAADEPRAVEDERRLRAHYDAVLLDQRRWLRSAQGAGSDDVQRALALAAPELPDRWRALPAD